MGSRSRFKIRFKPLSWDIKRESASDDPSTADQAATRGSRSRLACHNCRLRHVKCDEKFPICTQCQRKGVMCMPKPRLTQWQVESPGLDSSLLEVQSVNKRLLRYWLEKASQIMVLDPDNNPTSFPLVQHLSSSKSLLHAIQCLSAGYESFFSRLSSLDCLEERSKALAGVREELGTQRVLRSHQFLTVYMLGVSSSWIDQSVYSFGQEHLRAGRVILEHILTRHDDGKDSLRSFVLGQYIFWDMACSLLVDAKDQIPLDTPKVYNAVQLVRDDFHPIVSCAIELFYELACLGRYCRRNLDLGECDLGLEARFEERLLQWHPATHQADRLLSLLNESFRLYGLILLYRICRRSCTQPAEDIEMIIACYATKVIDNISEIRTDCSYFKFTTIPLFGAGAELPKEDAGRREKVVQAFEALYAVNRLPCNFWALQLLDEYWTLKDQGTWMSWVELMLQKEWRLMLG